MRKAGKCLLYVMLLSIGILCIACRGTTDANSTPTVTPAQASALGEQMKSPHIRGNIIRIPATKGRRGNHMNAKGKLYRTTLLLLAIFILSASFMIDLENITRVLARDSRDSGDIYAVSSQGDILDFRSMALEISKTYLTEEYNNKLMPSRLPGEVEASKAWLPNTIVGDEEKPAKFITQPNTRGLP